MYWCETTIGPRGSKTLTMTMTLTMTVTMTIIKARTRPDHRIPSKVSQIGMSRVSFAPFQCLLSTNIALYNSSISSPWLCQTSAPFSPLPTLSSTATCKPLFSKYRWLLELRFHIVMALPFSNLISHWICYLCECEN